MITRVLFDQFTPGQRDEVVYDQIRRSGPLSGRQILGALQCPPLEYACDDRHVDSSLQRLRRAGKIRVYPKRGLWSLAVRT